jgi:hypothetical protein
MIPMETAIQGTGNCSLPGCVVLCISRPWRPHSSISHFLQITACRIFWVLLSQNGAILYLPFSFQAGTS